MAYTTINKSTDYFNTVTYSGTGSAQSITGVGFKPDWLWIKHREDVSNHKLQDVVRGSTKVIGSNETDAEATVAQGVTSFDSDGFSLGTDVSVNGTGAAGIVGWNWLAGGNQGSSNTAGSINTAYTSVNTTAGFSISKYTGTGSNATVGHGLGVVPKVVLIKNISQANNWAMYHVSIGNTKSIQIDTNGAPATSAAYWNNTTPTSSVFTISTGADINTSGDTYIAYCFAEKTGYSQFGSVQGNGVADGPFIYTGFAPSFVLYRRNGTGDMYFVDNKRPGYNDNDKRLYTDTNQAEETYDLINLYSNGFKLTNSTHAYTNDAGSTYFYLAFGQSIVGSNNIPTTGR